jgi:transglutaminase-like putative cysteine protease
MSRTFWTSDRSALTIDGLVSAVLTLGFAQPFFYARALAPDWWLSIAGSLAAAGLVLLISRRWFLAPALAVLLAVPAGWSLYLGYRSQILPVWATDLAEYLAWVSDRLLLGGPEPPHEAWLVYLRLMLLFLISLPVVLLVRKLNSLAVFSGLVLIMLVPFLIVYPSAVTAILPAVAGLILLLPVSLIRQIQKRQIDAILPRAPLQWLALPVAILTVLSGHILTPADTRHWRQHDWISRLQDLQDFWINQSGESRNWQAFSLAFAGFQSAETQLGGPARPVDLTFFVVNSPVPVLLRGVTRTHYTGSSWQTPPQQIFRLNSPLWALPARIAFAENLPSGPDGRSFLAEYSSQVQVRISPVSRRQTTLFTALRFESLYWSNSRDYPPYFTHDGDLFVFDRLPDNPDYLVTVTHLSREKAGFAAAVETLEQSEQRRRDPYWNAIRAQYLQLPDALPDLVRDTALAITAGIDSPYGQAVALERILREQFTYTLDPDPPPSGIDFVQHVLTSGQGYCVHFASAMTIMARSLGIPARYVEGFTLIPAETRNAWRATGKTAHAWSELYFQGIGWLPFDATPAERTDPVDDPVDPIVDPPEPTPPIEPEPTPDPGLPIDEKPQKQDWTWLLALLLLAALSISARLGAVWLRREHLRRLRPLAMHRRWPELASCLEAGYSDLLRQLACLGLKPESGETLVAFAERAQGYLRLPPYHLPDVLWPLSRLRYGGYAPTRNECDALLELRLRLEERLRESLSPIIWFWRRAVPTFLLAGPSKR